MCPRFWLAKPSRKLSKPLANQTGSRTPESSRIQSWLQVTASDRRAKLLTPTIGTKGVSWEILLLKLEPVHHQYRTYLNKDDWHNLHVLDLVTVCRATGRPGGNCCSCSTKKPLAELASSPFLSNMAKQTIDGRWIPTFTSLSQHHWETAGHVSFAPSKTNPYLKTRHQSATSQLHLTSHSCGNSGNSASLLLVRWREIGWKDILKSLPNALK